MRKISYIIILSIFIFSCTKKELNVDILITNGIVYNGIDTIPSNNNVVAIQDDEVVYFGSHNKFNINAKKTIDATGLIVAPGFIDPHTHADRDLNSTETNHNLPFLMQGITTVVVGNDGDSFYPVKKYAALYEEQGIGTNAILLTGHGTIREQVMGRSDKLATSGDIAKMQALIQEEMDNGSFGMSTGLFYAPGSYSNTDEVIQLAQTVAKNNGIYDTHLRDESSYTVGLIPAVEEAVDIGRKAKLPIHISHIKCLGVDVWKQSDSIITIVENAQKEGINITASQYPYDASATGLKAATVPRWAESGGKDSLFIRFKNPKLRNKIIEETKLNIIRRGGPEKLLIVKSENTDFVGKNLKEIAEDLKIVPELAVYEVLNHSYARVASFNMNPHDIHNFMVQPWVYTCSDGNTGHPRKYGTFPRKYSKYIKQEKVMDLGTFVNISTSKTAEFFGLKNRGVLKEGFKADVIVFHPEEFRDIADYKNSFEYAKGLEFAILNGELVVNNGEYTDKLAGKVLKK